MLETACTVFFAYSYYEKVFLRESKKSGAHQPVPVVEECIADLCLLITDCLLPIHHLLFIISYYIYPTHYSSAPFVTTTAHFYSFVWPPSPPVVERDRG